MLVVLMHNQIFFRDYAHLTGDPIPTMSGWYRFLPFGGVGVHIFFVISGFIMGHLHERTPTQSFGAFVANRFTRIVPLYWIVAAVCAWNAPSLDPEFVIESLLFIPVHGVFPLVGVGWTLNFEIFFYLLFGLIVVKMRRSIWWIAAVFAALAAIAPFTSNYVVKFYADPIAWEFVAGLVIHRVYRNRYIRDCSPLILTLGVAGLIWAMVAFNPSHNWGIRSTIHWGLPSALLVLGAVSLESMGMLTRVWSFKPMQEIGAASYSLYLTHGLMFIAFNWYFLQWTGAVEYLGPDGAVIALVVCACIVASISLRVIELPAMRLLRGNRASRSLSLQLKSSQTVNAAHGGHE